MVARAIVWALIACLASPISLSAQTSTLTSPLKVEYGGPIQKELTPGEVLTLRPSLRNIGSQPITVAHGVRFFVLDAQFFPPHVFDPLGEKLLVIPRDDTWGEVKHLEYPNPYAVYPMILIEHTLASKEVYAPQILDQKSEFAVHFTTAGTYKIRVCANLVEGPICGPSDIVLTIK